MSNARYSPLLLLTLARLREFYREPAAIFWVYGFPLIIVVALGIAFREQPVEDIQVDVRDDAGSPADIAALEAKLAKDGRIKINAVTGDAWERRLQSGRTDLVIAAVPGGYEFWDLPSRKESILARHAVESLIYKEVAPTGPTLTTRRLEARGQRYIDFLLPGLLGMNLMGGGLWGVGYVLADMRIRKLLKRFVATPMRRSDFLLSVMFSRLIFTIPEVLILLVFGYFAFDVRNAGDFPTLLAVIVIGAFSFGGLGLLVASRVKTVESVSGLMNLIMLPMWILSGVFFSADRFPEFMQPFIQILPLTALNNALRGVMLEGQGLASLGFELGVLAFWGVIPFAIALKIFRWQ
jgi:ABC-2 type transport system permease protein